MTRALRVWHHIERQHLASTDDRIQASTWIVKFSRVRSQRRYQFVRLSEKAVLAKGETDWVYIDVASGRPRSIPDEIKAAFTLVPGESQVAQFDASSSRIRCVSPEPVERMIMRDSIRKDLLIFVLPAILVYSAGFGVCAWDLVRRQGSLFTLSAHSLVGLALIVIGLTLTFVAVGTLQRFYSPTLRVRRDHQLITHGPYRFVRHPLYTGAGMATVGVPVYASSLAGLLILLTLIPLVVNRIRIEEQMMTAEFGDSYRAYARGTKKLIPFVY